MYIKKFMHISDINTARILTTQTASNAAISKQNISFRGENDRDCFESREEYNEYNNELTQDFNDWLNGDADDQSIMDYAFDCSNEQIGLFNAFKMAEYLQKKGVI